MNVTQINIERVLEHMLGYVDEKQLADAKSQRLEKDDMHLLGYLDTPHWVEAYKLFPNSDDSNALISLAKKVDERYNTNFAEDMLDCEN